MEYDEFLQSKRMVIEPAGFTIEQWAMNNHLFDWQNDVVKWALHRGRSALFEDCGLGKTLQQLEWAHHVCQHTGGSVLILAPLAVARQTHREGEKFGYEVTVCRTSDDYRHGINVANYERLHHFDPSLFSGIVLDESSILKAFDGKTRKALTDFAETINTGCVARRPPRRTT
jgi:SNF2 family N-terminal domain.